MQLSTPSRHDRALTLIEVIVVIGCVFFLMAILLPELHQRSRAVGVTCINNLRQDALAAVMWQQEHNGASPQNTFIAYGGERELLSTGNVAAYFQSVSHYLRTPNTLRCPGDREHVIAKSFSELNNTNISYFVSLNPNFNQPQTILFGDDDFVIDGIRVKPGITNPWTNHSIAWTANRHKLTGYIAFCDGHVQPVTRDRLTNLLAQPGAATNLIVIP